MAYQFAPQQELANCDQLLENGISDDEGYTLLDSKSWRQQLGRLNIQTALQIFTAAVSTLLCILLVFNLAAPTNKCAPIADNRREYLWKLGNNESYMSLDHKYDQIWDADRRGKGTVVHYHDSRYNGDVAMGTIAMLVCQILISVAKSQLIFKRFHQLHCLAAIRKSLQDAYYGQRPALDHHDDEHFPHCLDYLHKVQERIWLCNNVTKNLQVIVCNADNTFEPEDRTANGTKLGHISGADSIRSCMSTELLYNALESIKIN